MSNPTEERRIDREIHFSSNSSDPFASAVRATRMPMLITDPRQPDNPIIFVNDAFGRLTGYSREETLGRNCRFLQGHDTDRDNVQRIRDAVARRVSIEIELLNYKKDGSTFWNRLLISPVFDGEELTYFFASQFDVTREKLDRNQLATDRDALESELHERIGQLTASEERLRFALTAGRLGFWTLDMLTNRLVASAPFKAIFGRAGTDTFTFDDLLSGMHPGDRAVWDQTVERCFADGGKFEFDFRFTLPDGEQHWVELRGQASYRADGAPLSLAGVALDISERKRVEQHRDLLTREMDHRVKNTLATVQSIFSQTLRNASSLADANAVISKRIQALAGAHDVLTQRGWERATLHEIVSSALRPFADTKRQRLNWGGPDTTISPRAATALTLALHELATNAVKYGALSTESGRVIINWQLEDHHFTLTWQEVDGPAVATPTRRGFGSRMIEQALAASLQGEAGIEYHPAGILFRLRTHVDHLLERTTDDGLRTS